ncbi:MAG TPA: DUF2516 family protein [Cellulomonas sp.]
MIVTLQLLIFLVFYLAIFLLAVWALVDSLRRPARAFLSAGKQTKQRWTIILVVATLIAFVAIPYPVGIGRLGFLALLSAVAAVVYLVDVKPAVAPYSGRRGGGGSSSPGGW